MSIEIFCRPIFYFSVFYSISSPGSHCIAIPFMGVENNVNLVPSLNLVNSPTFQKRMFLGEMKES